ncbi:HlyD family efflux transporter periplasmic adaptor subunit [Pirellulaceae bacterium]|jgi:multidrug efflux pump subunit AcrA (membrane-fusion protein)|nr:HlyD family efflux transporter periplasmic adaptor subunit [Pirellulaceae bacterium]
MKMKTVYAVNSVGFLMFCLIFSGCSNGNGVATVTKPRPVEVKSLESHSSSPLQGDTEAASLVSATIGSWKTEKLGIEVGGRLFKVAFTNQDILGRIVNKKGEDRSGDLNATEENGGILFEQKGTVIAAIDSEEYQLQVKKAQALIEQTQESIAAAKIFLDETIPSQKKAAIAEKDFAELEKERSQKLFDQNAGALADVQRDKARFDTAIEAITQIDATKKSKDADLLSLQAELLVKKNSLRDAQRNLENCNLYSSFDGQIAEVSVVPGSIVTPGQPIATVQMMDPIKIELEVSADESRRLRNRLGFPVYFTNLNGESSQGYALLYRSDAIANPETKTFTLTLLMKNSKAKLSLPENEKMAFTKRVWPLQMNFISGYVLGSSYAEQSAILDDDTGSFVWQVTNMKKDEDYPENRDLAVQKMRVKKLPTVLSFLNQKYFREIQILDGQIDAESTLIAGEISVGNGDQPEKWNGTTLRVQDREQWMLRPGDLVKVDLSEQATQTGFFVPMSAIAYDLDKEYLFLVPKDYTGGECVVERVEVTSVSKNENGTDRNAKPNPMSFMRQIKPVAEAFSLQGRQYVTRGAHYLRDGENVKVIASGESQ